MLSKKTYPGVKEKHIEERTIEVSLKAINNDSKYIQKYKKEKKKGIEAEEIALQELLLPSTRTALISCIYFLEIHFTHCGITLGSKIPPATMPLYIYAPSIPWHMHKIAIPDNWQPCIFQKVELSATEQP